MSKKIKEVSLGSTTPYGVGLYEDDRARMKYQILMQDYHELQKEVDLMRSRLDGGKRRKMILTGEVRFLRRRFEYLMKTKTMNSSQEKKPVRPQIMGKQMKNTKGFSRREANISILPPAPEVRIRKKQHISKVALSGTSPVSEHHRKMLDGSTMHLSHKGRVNSRRNNLLWNAAPVLDLNKKERMHAYDTTLSVKGLNQGDDSSGKESSMRSRAPIFDLNEISTGDEDFDTTAEAVRFDKARRSLMRHPNDEVNKELILSVCRNAGEEPSSNVAKRKMNNLV